MTTDEIEKSIEVTEEKLGDGAIVNADTILQDAELMYFPNIAKKIGIPASNVVTANNSSILKYGCVPHPFNASEILQYKALDATYQTCIEIKRDTIAGLGYRFGAIDAEDNKQLMEFFSNPSRNFSDTFISTLKNVQEDLETFHNGYMEFVKSGETRAIYYLPAKDMYIKPKAKKGLTTRTVDKFFHLPSATAGGRVRAYAQYEPYPVDGKTKDGTHYVIHFKVPSQEDLYYGKPDVDHLYDMIKQSYLSDQYNINFFSNGGQPAWAVTITGGKLSKKSYEAVQQFITNSLKGVDNAHKMLFLSIPNEKAKVSLIPLSKSIDEQFITLNDKLQFKIALKCRVMPKLLGLSGGTALGGGSAGIADLKLFIETVCLPSQLMLCNTINKFIANEFGKNYEFTLKTINISNEKDNAVIASAYWNMLDEFGNRGLGINEIRQIFLNLKPLDLMETPIDESNGVNPKGAPKLNATGDLRTTDNSSTETGDGEDASNLDSEKNKE